MQTISAHTSAAITTPAHKYTPSLGLSRLLSPAPACNAGPESLFIPMLRQQAKNFGVKELANHLGKTPKILNNELNPNSPEHKLGFDTAVALCEKMGSTSVLRLWAHECGLVVFEPPLKKIVDDLELVTCMSSFTKEVGDVAAAVHTSLGDLRITAEEVTTIKLEAHEAIEAMFQLIHRIEELQEK